MSNEMSLLDLIDPPTARNTDPGTSHSAASLIQTGSIRQEILAVLMSSQSFGLATFEIAERIGVPRDYVSPHMKPLEKMGLVQRLKGFERVNPKTKNKVKSEVWIVTSKYLNSDIPKEIKRRAPVCPHCKRPY